MVLFHFAAQINRTVRHIFTTQNRFTAFKLIYFSDGSVCFYKACVGETTSTRYCFKNGVFHGIISYYLKDTLIKTFNSSYHGYHTLGVKQLRYDMNRGFHMSVHVLLILSN